MIHTVGLVVHIEWAVNITNQLKLTLFLLYSILTNSPKLYLRLVQVVLPLD